MHFHFSYFLLPKTYTLLFIYNGFIIIITSSIGSFVKKVLLQIILILLVQIFFFQFQKLTKHIKKKWCKISSINDYRFTLKGWHNFLCITLNAYKLRLESIIKIDYKLWGITIYLPTATGLSWYCSTRLRMVEEIGIWDDKF